MNRTLGLFDVFSISTGAMFSSGFFLLPGIAYSQTGTSVIWAYLVASLLIMPALLSVAELSTALPRSGGSYYLIDRSLGPLIGTIGGLGTYLALVFKTTFALIGIGAYLSIFYQVPVNPLPLPVPWCLCSSIYLGPKKPLACKSFCYRAARYPWLFYAGRFCCNIPRNRHACEPCKLF
ncbi:MAG: APC family permease [Bacteroidales bacterium]|nr:APC family permease [Bacteroidales bacterium]